MFRRLYVSTREWTSSHTDDSDDTTATSPPDIPGGELDTLTPTPRLAAPDDDLVLDHRPDLPIPEPDPDTVHDLGPLSTARDGLVYRVSARDGAYHLTAHVKVDDLLPRFGLSFAEIAARAGRLYRRISRFSEPGRGGLPRWLRVCSAGNSNVNAARKAEFTANGITLREVEVFARTSSGCAHAAAEGDPHFLDGRSSP